MAGTEAGDDYYDPESGYRVIWGDSCWTNAPTDAKIRILTEAVWAAGGSSNVFVSRAALTGGDSWTLAAVDGASVIAGHTRPGVHPVTSLTAEEYLLFFLGADGLYRQKLIFDGSSWTWEAASAAGSVSAYDGAAVHPLSETQAIVVGYKAPYLWVQYAVYSGSWTITDAWYVHIANEEQLRWSDAHWSDAVLNPENSNEVVVALNLSRWGSTQVVIYNIVSGIWSQPKEMFPSQEQWGNMKCVCSGLSVINSRIWAVTVREPWASGDTVMAHHVALMSSPNGQHWRDEDFVTISTMRGKLIYVEGEDYCYVVGNSAVARASATTKLGYDSEPLEYQIDEAYELSHTVSGPSSAAELTIRAKNVAEAISDAGLAEAGNEIDLDIGTATQELGDVAKGLLVKAARERSNVEDEIALQAVGMMSKLVGSNAYRPAAAKVFDGPYSVHSRFVFDETGGAKLTVKQETGTWVAKRYAEIGRYVLHCQKPGISLLPHAFQHHSFIARVSFMPRVSIEGIYFVFWYEDEENYWQAGIYNNAGTYELETRRMTNGILGAARRTPTDVGAIAVNNWYTMYLDVRPGQARVYFKASDSYDYSVSTFSVTDYPFRLVADLLTAEFGDLQEYHVGLKVDSFEDWEGAVVSGDIEEAGYNYLEDTGTVFTDDVLGKYVSCNDQDRRINAHGVNRVYITPGWSVVPEVGDEYGIYPESAKNGPGCYFKELWVCEAIVPSTVDDVINSILELAGVSRSVAFSGTGIGATGSGPLAHDVDAKFRASTTSITMNLWQSTQTFTGDASAAYLLTTTAGDYCSLYAIDTNGNVTLEAQHPTLVYVPVSVERVLRIQANHKFIVVSCDGHFITAFPCRGYWPGGYISMGSLGGTATTTEFTTVLDSFAWDTNEPAGSALSRLLRGRRAKMIERADGSVAVSKFDVPLGNAGTYDVPVTRLMTGEDDAELVSLVEMVGADDRAFYIDFDAARKKLRYVRADNPTLETQFDALVEAAKLTGLAMQRYGSSQIALYVPDPGLELEAECTVDGTRYIVEAITFSINTEAGAPKVTARIAARGYPEGIVVAHYDVGDNYDQGGEYS